MGRTCLEEAECLVADVAPQLVRGGGGREVGRTCLEEAERLLADVAPQLVRGGGGGGRGNGSGAYLS